MTTATRCPRFPGESAWVGQFDKNDRALAEALLDTVLFVPQNDFVRWVSDTLIDLHTALAEPLAVYAARESSGSYFPDHRGRRPTAVIEKSVGSEGVVAQRVERLSQGRAGFYSHPCLTTLRRNSVHNIVLVDDTLGSGNRVLQFLASMHMHPTFKSWVSRHLLRFWVVAYVATDSGRETVSRQLANGREKRKYYTWIPGSNRPFRNFRQVRRHHRREYPEAEVQFHFKTDAPSYDSRLRDLADRYGRRFRLWYRFGYGNGFTLVAYDHGCPNNAPGILWERRPGWMPLFRGRAVSIPSGVAVPSAVPFAAAAGGLSQDARAVLGQLANGTRHPSRIARSIGIPRAAVLQRLDELRQGGLVSSSGRLVARHSEIAAMLPTNALPGDVTGSGTTYVPTQLRGASDAF